MNTGLDSLKVYKPAEDLEFRVHKTTQNFIESDPRTVDQLRRSSASTTENISEGYARFTFKDKANKFYIARGEAEETRRGIYRAFRKHLITEQDHDELYSKYTDLLKMVNGYIRHLKDSEVEEKYKGK